MIKGHNDPCFINENRVSTDLVIFDSRPLNDLSDAEDEEAEGHEDDDQGDQEGEEGHCGPGITLHNVWTMEIKSPVACPIIDHC